MVVLKEITDWNPAYNHTYLFDGDKALAYIKHGTKKPIYLEKPLRIDRARRKFVEVKVNPFKKKFESNLIRVDGSKGNVYHIDPDNKTCTCTGYKFHGRCKHLKNVLGI